MDIYDQRVLALAAEYAEAARCVAIFSNDIARLRPFEAWMHLPLGASIPDTIGMLMGVPIEGNAAEVYPGFHATLLARRARALAAYEAHRDGGTPRGTKH